MIPPAMQVSTEKKPILENEQRNKYPLWKEINSTKYEFRNIRFYAKTHQTGGT